MTVIQAYEQVPANYPIHFLQGDDLRVPVQLLEVNAAGIEVPLNLDAYTLTATLYLHGIPVAVFDQYKPSQVTETGWIEFSIDRTATTLLGERFYTWDVKCIDPDNELRTLIKAEAVVIQNG